jgi:hypothetical protein
LALWIDTSINRYMPEEVTSALTVHWWFHGYIGNITQRCAHHFRSVVVGSAALVLAGLAWSLSRRHRKRRAGLSKPADEGGKTQHDACDSDQSEKEARALFGLSARGWLPDR